jgi:hypothetical protein
LATGSGEVRLCVFFGVVHDVSPPTDQEPR